MTNALSQLGDLEALKADLQESSDDASTQNLDPNDALFATFKSTNMAYEISPWVYGDNADPIHPDSVWVVDVTTMLHGWMGYQGDGKGGRVKGQKPDSVYAKWSKPFPKKPEDKPWVDKKAYKWCAKCFSSPIDGQEGTLIEVADGRAMSRGFGPLEMAVRARIAKALRLQADGDNEGANALLSTPHPTVKFGWREKVQTNNGIFHGAIITRLDEWVGEQMVSDNDAPEPEPEEPPKRRRRRQR